MIDARAAVKFSLAFSAWSYVSYLLLLCPLPLSLFVPLLIVPFFTEDRANHSESGMQSSVQLVPSQMIHIASGREILTGGGEKQQMTSLTSLKRKHIGSVTIIPIISFTLRIWEIDAPPPEASYISIGPRAGCIYDIIIGLNQF